MIAFESDQSKQLLHFFLVRVAACVGDGDGSAKVVQVGGHEEGSPLGTDCRRASTAALHGRRNSHVDTKWRSLDAKDHGEFKAWRPHY